MYEGTKHNHTVRQTSKQKDINTDRHSFFKLIFSNYTINEEQKTRDKSETNNETNEKFN